MTYRVTFFLQTCGLAAESVTAGVLAALSQMELGVRVSDEKSGENWKSAYLGRDLYTSNLGTILLEAHTDPSLVQEMTDEVADESPTTRIFDTDAVLTLTLIGNDTDWVVVRSVWASLQDQ